MSSLARKSFFQFSSRIILSLLGLVSTFFIAHYMGAEVLGTIGYLLSVLGIFAIVLDFGFGQAHIKRVSEGKDLGKCIGTFFSLKAFFYFLFLFGIGLVLIISQKLGYPIIESPLHRTVFLLLLFSLLFKNISAAITSTFQAKQEMVKYNIPLFLGRLSQVLLIIPLALLGYGIIALSITYLIEGAILLIVALLFFKNYPVSLPDRSYLKSYFVYALPLILVIPLAQINVNINQILIKTFWDFKEVGFFFAIQTIINIPKAISHSVMMLFLPRVSQLWAEQKIKILKENTLKTLKYLSVIIIPICVLMIFFRREIILLIFGKEFLPASPLLVVFAVTVFFITLIRPYSNILYGISKHQIFPLITILGIIVLVFSNLILIPRQLFNIPMFGLGALGAAISILNSWIVYGLIIIYLVRRHTKIGLYKKTLLHLLAGAIMYSSLYLPGQLPFFNILWLKLSILPIFSLLVYGIILILFRELTRKDIHFIKKIIRPSLMTEYIKGELKNK